MKKINPKIVALIVLLLSILFAGAVSMEETAGPGFTPPPGSGGG